MSSENINLSADKGRPARKAQACFRLCEAESLVSEAAQWTPDWSRSKPETKGWAGGSTAGFPRDLPGLYLLTCLSLLPWFLTCFKPKLGHQSLWVLLPFKFTFDLVGSYLVGFEHAKGLECKLARNYRRETIRALEPRVINSTVGKNNRVQASPELL